MTALMTRAPLHQLENYNIMSEGRRGGRRTSARLADKEEAQTANQISLEGDPFTTTTVVVKGTGQSGVAAPKVGKKRKPAYEEEDDGFSFTRKRSKKVQVPTEKAPVAVKSTTPKPAEPVPVRKVRRKSFSSPVYGNSTVAATVKVQAKPRREEDQQDARVPVLSVKKRRKSRSSPDAQKQPEPEQGQEDGPAQVSQPQVPEKKPKEGEPQAEQPRTLEIAFDPTKISLPFADTPIIRRNKEMRRGAQSDSRRSSLGLRGRRASSLIETGKSALPHNEVASVEFYKHIEGDGLSEPRRMRQLLTWCGSRALGEKPSSTAEDGGARMAAREIQSELLKEFTTRSELSDWFDRKEVAPPSTKPRPNPKNLSNLAKIAELEEQIARLQTEAQAWQSVLDSASDEHSNPQPPSPQSRTQSPINAALLSDPEQRALLSVLQPLSNSTAVSSLPQPTKMSTPAPPTHVPQQTSIETQTATRVHAATRDLEFEIDKFATNVHAVSAYRTVAERLADESLAASAQALETRDKDAKQRALDHTSRDKDGRHGGLDKGDGKEGRNKNADEGMRDVIRTLSRVIDD